MINNYFCEFCRKNNNFGCVKFSNVIYQLHGPVKVKDYYKDIDRVTLSQTICPVCSFNFKVKPHEFLFKYGLSLL